MSETKEEVFEALLAKMLCHATFCEKYDVDEGWVTEWRERYEKAERFNSGYHDVEDLYEEEKNPL